MLNDLAPATRLLIIAFVGAIIVYGYPLTNFALHIDEENGAIYNTINNNIELGRWGISLIHSTLLHDPVVPFFTPLLSLFLLAVAAALAANSLDLTYGLKQACALLYVSLAQFAYQMEFLVQTECVALGLVCATLSYLSLARIPRTSPSVMANIALLTAAISFYQSIILIPLTLCLTRCLGKVYLDRESVRSVLRDLVWMGLGIIASYLLYAGITSLVRRYTGIHAGDYLRGMVGWYQAPFRSALSLAVSYLEQDLSGGGFYGNAIYATVWLAMIAIVVTSWSIGFRIGQKIMIVLLALAACAAPFALVLVLGAHQEPRTFVALPISYAMIWSIALARAPRPKWLPIVAVSASVAFGLFHVSRLFFADTMAWESDKLLGSRIVTSLYQADPAFNDAVTPVYFTGAYAVPNLWAADDYNMFGRSFFTWDGGNANRIDAFLKLCGIADLRQPSAAQIQAVAPELASLPTWPNPGAVKLVQGVLVVKLGSPNQKN